MVRLENRPARPPDRAPRVPFISVVIPVLNGERTIRACLAALLRTDYPADRREILVVDNGSSDRTPEIIRSQPVRYLLEEQRGPARARNLGIQASEGEILVFTDADCLASRGWLRELVSVFGEDRVGGVAGEILPYPPRTPAERYAARLRHLSPRRYLNRPIFPFAVTANLAFRRQVFAQTGLFDVASPRGGESTDFCTRFFRATGLELRFAPRAVVLHRHRRSAWELFHQQWGYGRGHAYLYIKYREEVPWGWQETANVYADLAGTALTLGLRSLRYVARRERKTELEFAYFELLRKVALRAGFVREALSQGYIYL